MTKYRKKPVVIEAIRLTRQNTEQIIRFTNDAAYGFCTERSPNGKHYCYIDTLEGRMRADEGDYIIKGVAGEFYPCKPAIFEQTYEAAE